MDKAWVTAEGHIVRFIPIVSGIMRGEQLAVVRPQDPDFAFWSARIGTLPKLAPRFERLVLE
jgi:hypothetical protein